LWSQTCCAKVACRERNSSHYWIRSFMQSKYTGYTGIITIRVLAWKLPSPRTEGVTAHNSNVCRSLMYGDLSCNRSHKYTLKLKYSGSRKYSGHFKVFCKKFLCKNWSKHIGISSITLKIIIVAENLRFIIFDLYNYVIRTLRQTCKSILLMRY